MGPPRLTFNAVRAPAEAVLILATTEEDMDGSVAALQFLHLLGELIIALNVVCDHHYVAGIGIHRVEASQKATEFSWERRDAGLSTE